VRHAALLTGALALLGAGGAVTLATSAVAADEAGALLPGALPVAFLVAGTVGARARPEHRGVQLLLAVGSLHLAGFAISEVWVATGRPEGTVWWALTAVSVAAFAAGFAALGVLLAAYPTGRLTSLALRTFAATSAAVVALVVLVVLLFSEAAPVVLSRDAASVPAPSGLPVAALGLDLQPALPLLVVVAVVVLVVRGRRGTAELRRHLEWASLAGILLATLLLATPAATALLPGSVWAVVFVSMAGLVPFALLGGLVRHRLLDVDVLVVRTLARGVMVVAVLTSYAVAASVLAGSTSGRVVASVVLTLVAALTGWPLLRRAEALADRWFTGGRIRRGNLLGELAATLSATDPEALPARIATTLREGLDATWVRLVLGDEVVAEAGPPDPEPAVVTDLRCGGEQVGTLQLGARRGGWGRPELARLERIAPQVAFALRDRELATELAARVEELTSSRARLVRAEETVRRQVERDLHDGVQQQLVALLARLSVLRELLGQQSSLLATVEGAQDLARDALVDLRRLVAGIHPALLGDRGLVAAVEARSGLLPIAVTVDADPRIAGLRFAPEVEGAAFFVVSEALANVMKHAGVEHARVVIAPIEEGGLRVAVADEGNGSGSYDGTGLTGLRDRVEALGGRFLLHATSGVGTTVLAEFRGAPVLAASDA
jgi:signal transduction histidine kinase